MRTQVMGIVNVTPDSFSDGGKYFRPDEALRRVRNMIEEGADIIDLGGESTRPGATPLGWVEEWSRLEPVMSGLKGLKGFDGTGVRVSVDTYHMETAERAIAAGADIINCVDSSAAQRMLPFLDAHPNLELVIPFRPSASQPLSPSTIPRLYLDPMIGFGTTREEDLALLRSIPELVRIGRVLVGVSRKRIVKKLTGEKVTGKNLGGNLGLAVWCALNGASVVRVHDVRETVQALRVVDSLAEVSEFFWCGPH